MPEGQDFITLNNLNSGSFHQLNPEDMKAVLHHYKLYHADAPSKSTPQLSPLFLHSHLCSYLFSSYMPYTERFWGFITAHWHDLKAQMMAYQKADSAAQEAHCRLEEPDELCAIWECICLAEYISLDGFHVDVQPPGAITAKVMDTYHKHPFHHPLLDNEAKETTDENLQVEVATSTASSHHDEQAAAKTSTSTSLQHRRLQALAQIQSVHFLSLISTNYSNQY